MRNDFVYLEAGELEVNKPCRFYERRGDDENGNSSMTGKDEFVNDIVNVADSVKQISADMKDNDTISKANCAKETVPSSTAHSSLDRHYSLREGAILIHYRKKAVNFKKN